MLCRRTHMKKIYFGAIATIGFLFVSLHAANNDSIDPFVCGCFLQKCPKKRELRERRGGGKRKKTYSSLEHKKHQGSEELMPEKELEKLRKSLAVSAEKQKKDKFFSLSDEQTKDLKVILQRKQLPLKIAYYSFVKNGKLYSLLP